MPGASTEASCGCSRETASRFDGPLTFFDDALKCIIIVLLHQHGKVICKDLGSYR